jgi:hypothetical protein
LIKGQVLLRLQNSVQRFNLAVQSNVSMRHLPLFPPVHLLFAFYAALPCVVFRLMEFSQGSAGLVTAGPKSWRWLLPIGVLSNEHRTRPQGIEPQTRLFPIKEARYWSM